MTEVNFTDAENTGAPLVPMVEESPEISTEDADALREVLEEVVWSHRL